MQLTIASTHICVGVLRGVGIVVATSPGTSLAYLHREDQQIQERDKDQNYAQSRIDLFTTLSCLDDFNVLFRLYRLVNDLILALFGLALSFGRILFHGIVR